MGWLRLVGSLKWQVSVAKEPYKRDYILQKRPIIWRSQIIVATPYHVHFDAWGPFTTQHEKLLGIQRVSNPSSENQRISTPAHSNGWKSESTLVRSLWYKSNKRGYVGSNPRFREVSWAECRFAITQCGIRLGRFSFRCKYLEDNVRDWHVNNSHDDLHVRD